MPSRLGRGDAHLKKPGPAGIPFRAGCAWLLGSRGSMPGRTTRCWQRRAARLRRRCSDLLHIQPDARAACERWPDTVSGEWLGWLALRENRLDEAAKNFAGSRDTGWPEWVAGRKLLQSGKYADQ